MALKQLVLNPRDQLMASLIAEKIGAELQKALAEDRAARIPAPTK